MSAFYRLVYVSKNLLVGSDAEVAQTVLGILEKSKRNNAAHDVTGALMFNGRAFAQVLEGPQNGVEATFERIQRDVRHGDVTVLQCGPADTLAFQNWSMAFVGRSPRGQALWHGMAAESGFDLARLNGDDVFAMLHGLVLEEEEIADPTESPDPPAPRKLEGRPPLPSDQIRKEIDRVRPDSPMKNSAAPAAHEPRPGAHCPIEEQGPTAEPRGPHMRSAETALGVLRSALAAERQRTTDLRSELDEARVALALSQERLQALREEASLWAARARLLASTLVEKADAVDTGVADGIDRHSAEERLGKSAA